MAANQILTTASVDNGTNLQSQVEYSADAQRPTGQASGVARSRFINKTLRQLSAVAAGVAQFIADRQSTDVTDGLTPTNFAGLMDDAIASRDLAVVSGTSEAIVLAFTPAATSFTKSLVRWRATANNGSATPTVTRDGLATKPLRKGSNQNVSPGDVLAGALCLSYYDPIFDVEILINPATGLAGGNPVGTSIMMTGRTAPSGYLVEDGQAYSRTAFAALFNYLVQSSTTTITIANPGVVTWTNHGRIANDPVKWGSTGVLPTGITPGATYYVVAASITTNTFTVSAAPGGSAIATTGSQSGTHTAVSAPYGDGNGTTTFNVPDSRGEFMRGLDLGRGVDANRGLGITQLDAMQGHVHSGAYTGFSDRSGGSGGTPNLRPDGANQNTGSPISDGSNGTPRTASETRPRNVPRLMCIKF